jgi:probable HAF family extracellular repeat protein
MKGVLIAVAVVASTAAGVSPSAASTTATTTSPTTASVTGTGIDPGHSSSWPTGVSSGGEVVGGHSVGNGTHGFVWRDGAASDLGTLAGGDYSLANGINEHGDIVGDSGTYEIPGSIRAVLWHDGVMQDLGSLGGNSFATAINSDGLIVGNSELTPSGAQFRAVMWRQGAMTILPTLDGSYYDAPSLLDDQGDAAGYSVLSSGVQHAVLWTGGAIEDLGPGRAVGLNSLGQVLVQGVDAQGSTRVFVWDHGSETTLPATVTAAAAINDSGQVAGEYEPAGATQEHGFLWSDGQMTDLGTLSPVALNDKGQVLASSSSAYGVAFVWDRAGVTELLPAAGASTVMPTAITDSGLITGTCGLDSATIWQLP